MHGENSSSACPEPALGASLSAHGVVSSCFLLMKALRCRYFYYSPIADEEIRELSNLVRALCHPSRVYGISDSHYSEHMAA